MSKLNVKYRCFIAEKDGLFLILITIEIGDKSSDIIIRNHKFTNRADAAQFLNANRTKIIKSIFDKIGLEMEVGGELLGSGETYH